MPTPQIPKLHEMLGTKNKAKQEETVYKVLTSPPISITVYFDYLAGKVDVRAMPGTQIPTSLVKTGLQLAIEQLTKAEALQEQQQAQASAMAEAEAEVEKAEALEGQTPTSESKEGSAS
jgi:hypothetical protein